MNQKDYERIINRNAVNLTEYVVFERIKEKLIQNEVISSRQAESIMGGPHSTNHYRMSQFRETLSRQHLEKKYQSFKCVLRDSGDCENVLVELEKTEEELGFGKSMSI